MKLPLLISVSLAALVVQPAHGQSADEFFHSGAQSYLTNNLTRARQDVDEGLKRFPDDVKLKKLDELLKRQQNQPSPQPKPQPQQDQPPPDQQKNPPKPPPSENKQPGPSEQPKPREPDKSEQPRPLTPQQAEQLLDQQKNDEALLPMPGQGKSPPRSRVLKDW